MSSQLAPFLGAILGGGLFNLLHYHADVMDAVPPLEEEEEEALGAYQAPVMGYGGASMNGIDSPNMGYGAAGARMPDAYR